mgnify:FL=1
MNSIIRQLFDKKPLSASQTYDMLSRLEQTTPVVQATILSLLAAKGESFEEILGARSFLIQQSSFDPNLSKHAPQDTIDIVGTGGDGIGTFNISTAASLVIASCGVPVAKHGGRSSTSLAGSTDVMNALNIPIHSTATEVMQSLHHNQYTYIAGASFNPTLKAFSSLRKQLGFPTLFNILGPLLNPLPLKRQVIGVYRKELVPIVALVLQTLGSIHALVVHAEEGLDEFSISGPNYVAEVTPTEIREYTVFPQKLGFQSSNLQEIMGGTPDANASLIQSIFLNQIHGAKLDIVLLNAAAGLLVADKVTTLLDGVNIARAAIASGQTMALLRRLQTGVK